MGKHKILENKGLNKLNPNNISNLERSESPFYSFVTSLGRSYDVINEPISDEIVNSLIQKWDIFLDSNNGNDGNILNKRNLSIAYEYSFNYMVNNISMNFGKDRMVLPIIRRIFEGKTGENDMNIYDIFNICERIITDLNNVDIDAYFCAKFSDSFTI